MRVAELFEADVVDFDAFRRKRDQQKTRVAVPDSLKYAAAHAEQTEGDGTLSDVARRLILRNLDKTFRGEAWSDEDRAQAAAIAQAGSLSSFWLAHEAIEKARKFAEQRDGVRYFPNSASPREAYLKDDPRLGLYHVSVYPKGSHEPSDIITFPTQQEMQAWFVTDLLRGDDPGWTDDEREKVDNMLRYLKSYHEHPASAPWQKPDPFDPEAVPAVYDGEPDQHRMIPALEKWLNQFAYTTDRRWGIWSLGGFGEPPKLEFVGRTGPSRTRIFPDMRAKERWLIAHKAHIEAWAKTQERVPDEAELQRTEDRLVRRLLGMIRRVLNDDVSEAEIEVWHHRFFDGYMTLPDGSMRQLLSTVAFDIKHPKLRTNISDFHLTWLPERVAELRARN